MYDIKMVRRELRKHIKKIDLVTESGKNAYYLKPQKMEDFISIYIYRDEFPKYEEGRELMDLYISHIYRFVEMEFHGQIGIMANIVYRRKRNMKDLRGYP